MTDPRRAVPRTDAVLADPRLVAAAARLGRADVKRVVAETLADVRAGTLVAGDPGDVADVVVRRLPTPPRRVINATGVVLHTNLGRAPLSAEALTAVGAAAGYTDVEFDLATGRRAPRGRGALAALAAAVPGAGGVLVANNGAAALALATTALAGGREVVVSRGEMVEIGDGFRLPDLVESTGVRLREVGTTNRVTVADYAAAVGPGTGAILKVHPSNFRIEGFTGSVAVRELAALTPPVIVDVGSGLLAPHPLLPDEPDVAGAVAAGAAVVTCSGDKLLGGPQAGLLFGTAEMIATLRRHPLYRAFRVDKLTLAALEATVRMPANPTWRALTADAHGLEQRCGRVARGVGGEVATHDGAVGGGSAPGTTLAGWAVSLPAALAPALRTGEPPVVGRILDDRLLLDLRCVDPDDDDVLVAAVAAARRAAG
ncbi:L-seryl-tRNA(Sec) selenium transferase [Jatrophihabitans endophyticus]|uniref:L-seryl-tRNA(Sec) selenium transferase n=1 Tax=Jatrophihabitans endophyticus TaxID=1206085 RepID=A0A1M5E5K6_9ACTN|nr:L-seryl-tRNA(Sec) selenium transferase [Jatrophihabitans endophyticus]SHF74523.1 L-seryl-tRNA(Sec) selenium transferase [Jatrophihabitans endophyticus]